MPRAGTAGFDRPPFSPLEALDRAAYLLDRALAPAPKVRAMLRAASVVRERGDADIAARAAAGTLTDLDGIGPVTAGIITDALGGGMPRYLADLERDSPLPTSPAAAGYRRALRGDCHVHSNWSDGGADIERMARAAAALGHDYIVLTDHSARLTVAHGLTRERLHRQLDEVARVNEAVAPFRVLTGLEVDILDDGSLDMDDDTLGELDVVVASVHSKLRMSPDAMTRRMVTAIASPHVDILGHCTGRKLSADGVMPAADAPEKRPPSTFDAEIVFAACARFDTAVEVNCRPERQDPPDDLLALALSWGCRLAVDTDAHAPGQLEWQPFGCEKLARLRAPVDAVVNAAPAEDLLAWARGR